MTARIRRPLRSRFNSSRFYLREWVADAAGQARARDLRVLDAGAGQAPYRSLFDGVRYETADFAGVDKPYGPLDHVCDLTDIPVPDGSVDLVLCSQVLEHLPEPPRALAEFHRILRPGGQAWLSAPLFYEEHEAPYDFYRYTRYAWADLADRAGFEVSSLEWLEGYLGTVSYQLRMAGRSCRGAARPLAAALLALAAGCSVADTRWKITDRGMPKNYRVVLTRR
jgi:SAM-dependent methyltransferase